MNGNYRQRIIDFIEKNGWIEDKKEQTEEYKTFYKEDNICIDINGNEIVLVGDSGDFLHMGINSMTIYTLLGYFIQHHILAMDYKW